MKTELITRDAIVGKHVEFTTRELEQMVEICTKVVKVIENHRTPNQKKEYLTDDDLSRIEAIFMCILESEIELASNIISTFT
jgi:hypothetical protein